jgi:deazaflavin-dependent oxidoreductase (nitroreductase family)
MAGKPAAEPQATVASRPPESIQGDLVSTPNHQSAQDPAATARYADDGPQVQQTNKFNKVARFLLSSPLHPLLSKKLLLISVTGRKTGAIYTTPIAYAQQDTHLLIAAGGRWRLNLAARPEVTVRLRGKNRRYRASITRDEDYDAQLSTMGSLNPTWAKYTEIELGSDGRPTLAAIASARARKIMLVTLAPVQPV